MSTAPVALCKSKQIAACDRQLTDPYIGGGPNGTNFKGALPLTYGSNLSDYDLSTPNEAYFSDLDRVINLAKSYNLVVFLNPIETGGWLGTLRNNGPAKAYSYGAYLGRRYKNFTNIVWNSGNDFQTWMSSPTDNNLVYQVMAGMSSADSNRLQTIELNFLTSYFSRDTTLSPVLKLILLTHTTIPMILICRHMLIRPRPCS